MRYPYEHIFVISVGANNNTATHVSHKDAHGSCAHVIYLNIYQIVQIEQTMVVIIIEVNIYVHEYFWGF